MTAPNESPTDPARSLALLWSEPSGTRGPKRTLSMSQIAQAGIELADADGLQALSMRKLADKLGIGTMSLYRYVPSKTELIEVMLDAALGEVLKSDNTREGWRSQLESYAKQAWEALRRHPWMLEVPFGRGLIGPNQAAVIESAFGAVAATGLPERLLSTIFTLVSSYVRGAAWAALEGSQLEKRTGLSDEQWWAALGPLMKEYITPDGYPLQTHLWAAGEQASPQEAFEFGLQRLLDGLETFIAQAPRT